MTEQQQRIALAELDGYAGLELILLPDYLNDWNAINDVYSGLEKSKRERVADLLYAYSWRDLDTTARSSERIRAVLDAPIAAWSEAILRATGRWKEGGE